MYVHDDGSIADEAKASVGKLLLPFGAHGKSLIITGWLSLSLSLPTPPTALSTPLYSTQEKEEEEGEKALELDQIKAGARTPYNC
jgi:hypothetical protein